MVWSKEQLDALLASGKISTEFYNSVVNDEGKTTSAKLKAEGEQAEEDLRLAQNEPKKKNLASDATDTGKTQTSTPFVQDQYSALAQAPQINRPYVPPPGTKTLPEVTITGKAPPPPAPEQKGLLNQAWDWMTGANEPQFDESGGKLKGTNPAGKAVAAKVEQQGEQAKKAEEAAPAGSLTTDQLAKPTGGAGMGAPATPPKPQFTPEMQGLIDRLENSYGDQKLGLSQIRDAAKAQSAETGSLQEQTIKDWETRSKLEADRQQREQDYMNEEIGRLKAKAEKLGSTPLDPERAWNNGLFKGNAAANKVLAGIGMLLGAGGTRKGGVNPAVKVINDAIDRDLEMQKVDLETGFKALGAQRGLLAQYMDVTHNRRVAESAAKLDYLQRAQFKMEQLSTKYQGPKADANYQIAAGALDQQITQQRIALQRDLENSAKIRAAGGGGSTKEQHGDQQHISDQLEKAGIPSVENAVSQAEDAITAGGSEGNMGILARGALNWANKANPLAGAAATGAYGAINPQALATEQSLQNLSSEYLLMKTGKAATDEERRAAADTLFGDRSPAAIQRGINMVKQQVQARKNNIYAGAGVPGRLEYSRRSGQEEQVGPTRPPGKPGAAK